MKRIIILTGVSASGKTTLQNELIKRGWKKPINFSTRKVRNIDAYNIDEDGDFNSKELDEYVFISRENFAKKLINGDFIENTQYGGNLYGISKVSIIEGDENICMILDPVGREQVLEYFNRIGIQCETYYIYISRELQEKRLINRGDKEIDILTRKKDFDWFFPTNKCFRINGELDTNNLADFIINNEI